MNRDDVGLTAMGILVIGFGAAIYLGSLGLTTLLILTGLMLPGGDSMIGNAGARLLILVMGGVFLLPAWAIQGALLNVLLKDERAASRTGGVQSEKGRQR